MRQAFITPHVFMQDHIVLSRGSPSFRRKPRITPSENTGHGGTHGHRQMHIMQFGNFNLPEELRVSLPARLVSPGEVEMTTDANGAAVRTTRTAWGELVATTRSGHPVKHPVESLDELRILKNIWSESHYEEVDGAEEACARLEAAIGDDGVYLPTLGPSPVQQLLQLDMGVANFYGLYQEHRDELDELLRVMHSRRVQEYEIVARRMSVPGLIVVENTSTTLISPAIYREYSLPQVRDFVRIAQEHGKKAILHMCGLLKGLTGPLKEAGLDGINGLTPPPVGDLPFEEAFDAFGEDLVVLGGILRGDVFNKESVTREEIQRTLDQTYSPRVRKASFLLWAPADGLPVPLERFLAVHEWMEQNGGN